MNPGRKSTEHSVPDDLEKALELVKAAPDAVAGAWVSTSLSARLKAVAQRLDLPDEARRVLYRGGLLWAGLTFKESPLLPDDQIVWVDADGVPVCAQKICKSDN